MNEAKSGGDYDFRAIESRWQKFWVGNKTFKTQDFGDKPKYYVLDMFPYPSGSGLHVGHPEGYTATDILARYKRMRGFNVLHPIGWDAFGLPAEQYAIKTGTHPRDTTQTNIDRFREQIQAIGLSYDWDREINTTDPHYYKWTQWIFRKLFERGLAYESYAPVNWCPALGTVLANEEVIDGKSEVGDHPVIKKPMRQWVLKITAYADRLLEDLDDLDWPESLKEMQRNWIGKSLGARIHFQVKETGDQFTVFTTRPDTLFGATFCVLAPEHPLVEKITGTKEREKVEAYIDACKSKSDMERTSLNKNKTGVFLGAHAINPANQEAVPIYIADYVLATYGDGAIMAVPGHDERDHEFAQQYGIPIKRVLSGGPDDINNEAHTGDGSLVNSDFLDGLDKKTAIVKMCSWLQEQNAGEEAITYKLRDWLFSRQRYWGEPFPLAHNKDGEIVLLDEKELPVLLPELDEFKPSPDGDPPLARAKDWLNVEHQGENLKRETNTMPQWAGSCWYYLRYIDPHNDKEAWDQKKENYWMPVDLYVGGVEHAVLHLLYARFWHKVLYDCGAVSTKEPFQKLVNQGMILGENGEKMSKSRGNVINPDDVIAQHGADSLRLYEMFMGPLTATKPWQLNGILGVHRFLRRAWRLVIEEDGSISPKISDHENTDAFEKLYHKTLKKVENDTESMAFNTAIAAMMEFVNAAYKEEHINKETITGFILMLSPYAPHIGEELWHRVGKPDTLAYEAWPTFNPALTVEDQITISIQVNGKLRGTMEIDKSAPKEDVLSQVKSMENIAKHLDGKTLRKEIYVPGKIVNFVVS